jgi:ATP-dependent RNA helicase DDX51/DBP6
MDPDARLAELQARIAARRQKRKLQEVDSESVPGSPPAKEVRFSQQEISSISSPPAQTTTANPSEPTNAPTNESSESKAKTKAKQRYLKRKAERRKARKKSGDKPTGDEKPRAAISQAEGSSETPEERQARKKAAKEAKRTKKEQEKAEQAEDEDGDEAEAVGSSSSGGETDEEGPILKKRKADDTSVIENSKPDTQQEPENQPSDNESGPDTAPSSSSSPAPLQRFSLPRQPPKPSASVLAELAISTELSDASAQLVPPSLTVHVDSVPALSDPLRQRLKDGGISDFFAGALFTSAGDRNTLKTHSLSVQATIIPYLLKPNRRRPLRDVCVSAPTGSGKTLAYAIPMIEVCFATVLPSLLATKF